MPTPDTLLANPLLLATMLLAAFLVGLSKGGLPAVSILSVPLLSLTMSPMIAAIMLLPIYILSDAIGVWLYRREFSMDNIKLFIPAGILGVILGWSTASHISDRAITMIIGLLGIAFCLYTWLPNNRSAPPKAINKTHGIFWGILSGFTSFIAHAGGPPFKIFVLPQKLPKMVFAGTTTFVFAAVNLAKLIPYSVIHPYTVSTMKVAALLVPAAAIGTMAGKSLLQRLPEKWFFIAVYTTLFLISIKLVVSSL